MKKCEVLVYNSLTEKRETITTEGTAQHDIIKSIESKWNITVLSFKWL